MRLIDRLELAVLLVEDDSMSLIVAIRRNTIPAISQAGREVACVPPYLITSFLARIPFTNIACHSRST